MMNAELMSWFEFSCRLAFGSTLIPGVGLLTILIRRKQSSATRHLSGAMSLIAMLLLPCVMPLLPHWESGILDARSLLPESTEQSVDGFGSPPNHPNRQRTQEGEATDDPPMDIPQATIVTVASPAMMYLSPGSTASDAEGPASSPTLASLPSVFASWGLLFPLVFSIYMFGAAVGFIRLLADERSIRRIILQSTTFSEPTLAHIVQDCSQSLSLNRRVEVRVTGEITVPVVAGTIHPVILLPHTSEKWSTDRHRAVIAHELAHVQRHDVFIQLVSRFVAVLYWPQPLVHCLTAIMRKERETACDDLALNCVDRRHHYARHLLEIAAGIDQHDRLVRSTLAMARCSNVEGRIEAVLSSTRQRKPPDRIVAAGMLVSTVTLLLSTTILSPFSALSGGNVVAQESIACYPNAAMKVTKSLHVASDEKPVPLKFKTHTFTGRVLLPNGEPAVNAVVRSVDEKRNSLEQVKTGATGRFTIQLNIYHTASRHSPLIVASESGDVFGFVEFQWEEEFKKAELSRDLGDISLKPPKQVMVKVVDDKDIRVPDAAVIVQAGFGVAGRFFTNEQGIAKATYPDGLALQTIGAVKAGTGCDYRAFEMAERAVDKSHPNKYPQGFEGDIKLVLNGVRQVSVKIVGPDDQPLAGIRMEPWYLTKPDRGGDWNVQGIADFSKLTDELGVAAFDILPVDEERGITIWPRLERDDWFVLSNRALGNEAAHLDWTKDDSVTVRAAKKVRVGGYVRHADSRPAANITVASDGVYHNSTSKDVTAVTDTEGFWQLLVKPNGYYMFVVKDEQFAAPANDGIVIRDSDFPKNLDFELRPACRVFGQVSGVVNSKTSVSLMQLGRKYQELPIDEQLPDAATSLSLLSSSTVLERKLLNADGSFEFKAGPGVFVIRWPNGGSSNFTIADEREIEFNHEVTQAVRGPVKITVVSANEPQHPIANARVHAQGFAQQTGGSWRFGRPWDAVTGLDGTIAVERDLVQTVVLAVSADKRFSGLAGLGNSDEELTIEVAPAAKVAGRLVNPANEPILRATSLELEIPMKLAGGVTMNFSKTTISTNSEGRFIIEGLCVGVEYRLYVVDSTDSNGITKRRLIETMTPDDIEVDVGDIKVPTL